MPKAAQREQNFVNIRVRPRTHNTLKAISSARGMQLIDLIDELAKPFEPMVDPLRQPNGYPTATATRHPRAETA